MDQKVFGIGFAILIVIAVVALSFSKLQQGTTSLATASPTPDVLFTNQASSSALQNMNQEQVQKTVKQYPAFPGVYPAQDLHNKKGVIVTNRGTIELEIYPEATKAASNFIFLAKDHFFDGLIFHRVENWVIQTGDPTGTGRGGPGYRFEDEPVVRPYVKGTVAMANSGPNTNGSQFFILTKDTPLPPSYTIFGKVVKGQDVADITQRGDVMEKVTVEPLR